MSNTDWILLDTETTGFAAPVFVVEIGAQRMRGWEPDGEPFRKLLNQNCDIPTEASRVHGYTREILERDGESAAEVYQALREYVGDCPVVAYHVDYDLEKVLKPEWARLGISPIGREGFCALRLVQRLLDPVPAGNCKLQTLRQYYRLPERGAHTALGGVLTVVDLFRQVLRPIAEKRGLTTWEDIVGYAGGEWYPSRIAFGKHKGRSIWEARTHEELRDWLAWLAGSSNERSAKMGQWYLRQLALAQPENGESADLFEPVMAEGTTLVIYRNPELEELQRLVESARARLAELEVTYTMEKAQVDVLQAKLFAGLRSYHQERDRLRLVLEYRRRFLETLLREGEEEAAGVEEEFQKAEARNEADYEETARAMESKRTLSADDETELKKLWKKLVNLYHPDRFGSEPDKQETYGKLTAAINLAKDNGDLETLRQIASDPHGFILRQGWTNLDFDDELKVSQLRKLWESLQREILAVIEATNQLRESAEYELQKLVAAKPELLDTVIGKQISQIEAEIGRMKVEEEKLEREIGELGGM